jgi:hypothetical protein
MPKIVPFVLAGGSKDVILLNIRREVIILIWLASSRALLLVLLASSRSRLRRSRDLPSALLQLSHEPALTRGVGRFLMTHKYRGCIVVLLINNSVKPNEEQKVLMSGFDQGITVNTSRQVFRGIW